MLLRATPPEPAWGGGGRVASHGGFSWSYGELPRPGARGGVIGSAGAGLGLIVRFEPQSDGGVAWRVLRAGAIVASGPLPAEETRALVQARWRRLWLRLDQRGLYLSLGDAVLLAGESAAFRPTRGYLHPLNHWSFALGACGLAPPQPRNGAWSVANVTMRAGARLRYADERLAVSLNGQQFAPGSANLTFRYHAAARPTALVPSSGPSAGATQVAVRAENLAGADPEAFECDFAYGGEAAAGEGAAGEGAPSRVLTNGTLLLVDDRRENQTDGAGGAAVVTCATPPAPAVGVWRLGLRLRRDGVSYSTHDDAGSVPLPYVVYPALPPNGTSHAPLAGPSLGGTLVTISLPEADGGGMADLGGARCRFNTVLGPADAPAALEPDERRAMRCASPFLPTGPAPVQLALNGLDFEPSGGLGYSVYNQPRLAAVEPPGAAPGTTVALVGTHLDGGGLPGVNHSCRFGEMVVPALAHAEPRVVANEMHALTLSCTVPTAEAAASGAEPAASVPFAVSLNGQQYTQEAVRFAFAAP